MRCFVAALAALALASCSDGGTDVTVATTPPISAPATTGVTNGAVATDAIISPPTGAEPAEPAGSATAGPTTAIASTPLGDPVVQLVQTDSATNPVDVAVRPGDSTLFVVQQGGQVIARRADTVDTVLDISDSIVAGGEQGLLGLAFHPTESFAYVNYTDRSGDTVIAEYAIDGNGVFDAGSARILLTIDQPYANHNGGEVLFGPDGMLYIGMGDGGAGGDPQRRALNLASPLGKILRIDVAPSDTAPYTIPADNPFVAVDGARGEIWSIGLRNPWRMSFDRATGDLWIADVGQNEWEEIDVAWAAGGGGRGMNFGWSAWEGNHRFNDDQLAEGATPPIFEYDHGDGCSVSGGVRYRGAAIPALIGWYVYSDYCSGQVRALKIEGQAVAKDLTLGQAASIAAVNEGPDGELLVLSLDGPILAVTPG